MYVGHSELNSKGNASPSLDWLGVVYALVRMRYVLGSIVFGVMVLTALISLTLEKWYESKATIILPEKQSSGLDIIGSLSGLGQSLLNLTVPSNQRLMAILKSQRLQDSLITKYDLVAQLQGPVELPEELSRRDTAAVYVFLKNNLIAEQDGKLNTITITFRYLRDAQQTADMTNYAVSKLDEINRELATEQARFTRQFIGQRYQQARTDLKKAEDSLNTFQKKNGIVAIPEQTKASIEANSRIFAEIVTTEVEYNVLKRTLGAQHPDLMKVEAKLNELERLRTQLNVRTDKSSVFIPFRDAPDLSLEFVRLYRDVQINQKIVEFLVPQFEQAKIQEAKDTPTILVLDAAKPAPFPIKPKKTLITIVMGSIAFLSCFLFVLIKETLSRSKYAMFTDQRIAYITSVLKLNKILKG